MLIIIRKYRKLPIHPDRKMCKQCSPRLDCSEQSDKDLHCLPFCPNVLTHRQKNRVKLIKIIRDHKNWFLHRIARLMTVDKKHLRFAEFPQNNHLRKHGVKRSFLFSYSKRHGYYSKLRKSFSYLFNNGYKFKGSRSLLSWR